MRNRKVTRAENWQQDTWVEGRHVDYRLYNNDDNFGLWENGRIKDGILTCRSISIARDGTKSRNMLSRLKLSWVDLSRGRPFK